MELEEERNERFADTFKDEGARRVFISRVFLILCCQLFVAIAIVSACILSEDAKKFFWSSEGLVVTICMFIVFTMTYYMIVCYASLRRTSPCNWILLFLLTISAAIMMGGISSKYSNATVLMALSMTCLICLVVTCLAICCPCDITKYYGYLVIFGITVIVFGVVFMIVTFVIGYKHMLHQIYAGLAVLLFSLFLWFDIQAVMGGHRIELSADEYILGAVQLYVDIIQIFLNMLGLMNN